MEKKIKDLKTYYLNLEPNFSAQEGFEDIMLRLKRPERISIYRRPVLYWGMLVLIIFMTSLFVLFPENNVVKAITKTANETYKSVFKSEIIKPDTNINSAKSKKPSSTPTPKVNSDKNLKPTSIPGLNISNEKRSTNPSQNDEDVKGASTINKPEATQGLPNNTDQRGNSEENKNDNASQNPSSDKSNGKNKN